MMVKPAERLIRVRTERNAVRRRFDTRLDQVKLHLEARSIPGRILDRVSNEARATMDEAIEVASENRSVIAGTIAALAIWFFRKPLLAWLESALGGETPFEEDDDRDGE